MGVQCVSGPGTCGNASYQWSIRNAPPSSTTTFTPNPQAVDQPVEMIIQTTDATPPGVYHSTVVITPVGNSPPSDPDTIPITVHIVCNYRLQSCPEIEIVDLIKGPDVVVSAPQPRQDTYVGRPMRLRMRQKAGTGGSRTYTMIAGSWILYGDQQSVVKSYDITSGTLTPLTAPEDLNTMAWYYVISNNTGEYPILAEATLESADGASFGPRATASYRAAGPSNVTLTGKMTPEGPTVGYWKPNILGLKLGDAVSDPTAGIIFSFAAALPAGDNGYLSATQLVNTFGDRTVAPGATPPLPTPPYNTNGSYWLDSCPLYGPPERGPNMFGPTVWLGIDAPMQPLTSQLAMVSRSDEFKIFMMYRPSGPQSIWVPLGNLAWRWNGKTIRTSSNSDDILLREGWTKPSPAASSADSGQLSSEFPTWTARIPYDQTQCAVLPTQ
jgi:hypothetical protein